MQNPALGKLVRTTPYSVLLGRLTSEAARRSTARPPCILAPPANTFDVGLRGTVHTEQKPSPALTFFWNPMRSIAFIKDRGRETRLFHECGTFAKVSRWAQHRQMFPCNCGAAAHCFTRPSNRELEWLSALEYHTSLEREICVERTYLIWSKTSVIVAIENFGVQHHCSVGRH